MSSPLMRLLKVLRGCAELYSRYWNLLVVLKNGFVSLIQTSDPCAESDLESLRWWMNTRR